MSTDNVIYFEMHFCPSVTLISIVRNFVSGFYQRVLDDPDLAGRLALATHELLENAVKYSSTPEATLRVEVDRNSRRVSICTSNSSRQENLDDLRARLDAMRLEPADDLYMRLMMEPDEDLDPMSGGLGLARIQAEAEMSIRCEQVGERINVFAEAQLPGGCQ